MNLYEVTNGWMGESYVRVYVWAATVERALELAREQYIKARPDRPDYANGLNANLLLSQSNKEFSTLPCDSGWREA